MSTTKAIKMTPERFNTALNLLERAMPMFEFDAPDKRWFKDYFKLTGDHAILTEDGWINGETYEQTDAEHKPEIWDEVNPPNGIDRSFEPWRERMLDRARLEAEIAFNEAVYVIVDVFAQGLHLTRDGEDAGVFSFEELKALDAVILGKPQPGEER